VGTALLVIGVYEAFDARAAVPGLTAYWRNFYLPISEGLHAGLAFATAHFSAVGGYFGLGPAWVALPLVLAGLVTIFRLGRPATALTVAALWPEMLAISAAHRYPFLDLRTSTFLFAVTASVAAIGVAGACSLLRPWLKGTLAAGLPALALAAFVIQAQPYVRSHLIPREDARPGSLRRRSCCPRRRDPGQPEQQLGLRLLLARRRSGPPARRRRPAGIRGILPRPARHRGCSRPGFCRGRAALSRAIARERACGKIWLVRTHMKAAEQHSWTRALHLHRLTATPVGHHGLSVIDTGGPDANEPLRSGCGQLPAPAGYGGSARNFRPTGLAGPSAKPILA
jgi:hypothetical protein